MNRYSDLPRVEDGAAIIAETFRSYVERFRVLTHRARDRSPTAAMRSPRSPTSARRPGAPVPS